ncbi:4-hydroxy-2-oxoheptanedioate aldolase [Rhizobiaceae bacterium BDR2-2]|uniref:4-hydroxy-2-oxoheptanedioate aldolase n=1 Tax=Ectorhizobium quercum TaxID=2965071 RepID=A0AAE3N4F1_9HYPH|nr:4-hydroxy-2-oxoheptanedioate aldolase [Ectorhizobium quercum]MCX8998327.1 4-hydroxy-2-oxoheptanedioate aldolase [Ectorhizobium quercum]
MPAPKNPFKQALKEGRVQLGLWQGLTSSYAVEICAGSGYDWLLLDGEHAPNDLPALSAQVHAAQGSPSHAVVRPPVGETWIIKQLLDIGAQTLLIPMVETREQAEALVRATRYPPHGVRGVGAALARASAYSRIPDYLETANDEICLLVQIESRAGLAAIDDIAALDGIDGIFIGPADLAADMGYLGRSGNQAVQDAIAQAFTRIRAHGKAAGILTGDVSLAKRYQQLGATFIAIGIDVLLLAAATERQLADFHAAEAVVGPVGDKVY